MKPEKVNILGLEMDCWKNEGCVAEFGIGDDWATLYMIKSSKKRQGFATKILLEAKAFYEKQGKRFGGSVALNQAMSNLYQKLGIKEYK